MIDGARRSFEEHIAQVGATLNDFFEGARRLTSDDRANWRLPPGQQPGARALGAGGGCGGAADAQPDEPDFFEMI